MFSWRVYRSPALAVVLALGLTGSGSAQTAEEADKLNGEVIRLYQAGKYAEAVPISQQALAISEIALGPNHPQIATSLSNLALLYRAQGRYREAEPLLKRGLAIRQNTFGAAHADVGTSLDDLGELYRVQDRFGQAEPLLKQALSIREAVLGVSHPDVAETLSKLALLLEAQDRFVDQARPLYERIMRIQEMTFGQNHPKVAATLQAWGSASLYFGEEQVAEQLLQRALTIREKEFGPDSLGVLETLSSLAGVHMQLGQRYHGRDNPRIKEAERLYKHVLERREASLGPEHVSVADTLTGLAILYARQERFDEAEPLFQRALAIREAILGGDHFEVEWLLRFRADNLHLPRRQWAKAAADIRQSIAIRLKRIVSETRTDQEIAPINAGTREDTRTFGQLSRVNFRLFQDDAQDRAELLAEAFEGVQRAMTSEAADAVTQMSVRNAMRDPQVAELVRERQDLAIEWRSLDKWRVLSLSLSSSERDTRSMTANVARIASIETRISSIDQLLARRVPEHERETKQPATSIGDVQSQLRQDEALIVFYDQRQSGAPDELLIWVITSSERLWKSTKLTQRELQDDVAALRCGLDATSWHGDGAKRCADLLKVSADAALNAGAALPFHVGRAYALYKSLFGETADLIRGKHLIVVPSGALTTLPFQVLITEKPASDDLAAARWLIRDHALTVLPSVASLKALRRTANPSAAPKPMIGFGNPLLDGNQRHPRYGAYYRQQAQLARAQTGCAPSPVKRTAALRMVARSLDTAPPPGGRFADLDELRAQTPLPETADELCEVARSVGGGVDDVRLGARATEVEVKRLSPSGELAKYRILHFATHGTLAGQLSGTNEPGLILTPPTTATPEDDGYLSSSEIASLKLDADWVILSACNTAGGGGQGAQAEALSGLARAFFYAGARALLVSHWEVDSDAAVKLVTGATGALSKEPNIGRAEALRRAILTVMADGTRPKDWVLASHPSVWAPFVVVGEGGAGK